MADNKNDDITDLTEEKPEKSKAKVKKPAAPPVSKQKETPKKANGDKKKSSKLPIIIICAIVVLIALCLVMVIMNLFGARDWAGGVLKDPLINTIIWLDPEFSSIEETLRNSSDERQAELDEFEKEIKARASDIEEREAAAETRDQQLNRRSDALDRREQNISQTESSDTPIFRRVLTEEEIAAMQSLSRAYAAMEPEAAAQIMAEIYSLDDSAVILFYMTERRAGAILAAMHPEMAARITEILLDYA